MSSKFNVGDNVKIFNQNTIFADMEGEIIKIVYMPQTGYNYCIKFAQTTTFFYERELEKIS